MLKFNSHYDLFPVWDNDIEKHNARGWPTVEETCDTISALTRATAWQIITGQAVYRGYEVKHDYDNHIHTIPNERINKIVDSNNRASAKRALIKQLKELGISENKIQATLE